MFQLCDRALEPAKLRELLSNPKAGAMVCFEGWVRNHNEGKPVRLLEYEAYQELAQREAENIIAEAKQKFEIYDAYCVHRVGALEIGELAVWVGVNAAHRQAAFLACQYVIDEVKARLPIWKKEHYVDGHAEWVNCQTCHSHDIKHATPALDQNDFYAKQILLKEIGTKGQQTLANSAVLVVGAGGLGCAALSYLAGAGVGRIGICEFDKLEQSNLHRQVLYAASDIGKSKLEVAAEKLSAQNPFVSVVAHQVRLDAETAASLADKYDLIVDCTDNFDTKFMLNDICVAIAKPLLQASIYQWEGQMHLYLPSKGSSCLRCLWPVTPAADCVGTCTEAGVLGAVAGVFGTMQSVEAIKVLLGIETDLYEHTLFVNLLNYETNKIKRAKNNQCPACSGTPHVQHSAPAIEECEIDFANLDVHARRQFTLIDIREPQEVSAQPLVDCLNLPLSQIDDEAMTFDSKLKYLFICQRGVRSAKLVQRLRAEGNQNVFSAKGGASIVAKELTQVAT